MPGLFACNRRWGIGSDDLMFPAFVEIWIRLFWLTAIAVVVHTHKHSFECSTGYLVQAYYIGMLCILSLHIVLDVLLTVVSSRGSIINIQPRRHIPILIYLKLALFVPELLWTILGTYWAFDASTDCIHSVVLAVKIAAIAGWIVLLSLLIAILIVFDPLGHINRTDIDTSQARKLWEKRCRLLCCRAGCDEQNTDVFREIAKLLTDFFQGIDFVATDVVAGLILVQQAQSADPYLGNFDRIPVNSNAEVQREAFNQTALDRPETAENSSELANTDVIVDMQENSDLRQLGDNARSDATDQQPTGQRNVYGISITEERSLSLVAGNAPTETVQTEPWMTVSNCAYYMNFALATYSWPVYMYMNLFCGCCKLCKHFSCCSCNQQFEHVTHDNCCACHTAAVLKITGVKHADLIHASFYNELYEIPFIVAMDHDKQTIVIAIRGTMSLKDALTDLCAEPESCDVEGLGPQYVHRGILNAAKYIQTTLENLNLLARAFRKGPNYRLVITGHSLGAGAAALLSILLRPKYANLICYAYSPPGGLLSEELARYTERFICSVVVGRDIIPRLSLSTLERLKLQILQQVKRCEQPKYRILAGGCWRAVCGGSGNTDTAVTGPHSPLVDDNTLPSYNTGNEQAGVEEAIHEAERACGCSVELHTPGVVLYLEEEEPTSGCCETPVYQPVWARSEHFREIIVHHKMILDHFPDAVLKALEETQKRAPSVRHMLKSGVTT